MCGQLCLYVLYELDKGNTFINIITSLMSQRTGTGLLTDIIPKDFKFGLSDGDVNAIDDIATVAFFV